MPPHARLTVAPVRALSLGGRAIAAWLCLAGAPAAGQPEPRQLRPGEGIEAVAPDSFRDGGTEALINAVVPPPPPTAPVLAPGSAPCPEPPRCQPESDFSHIAWLIAGLSSAGMLLGVWWGVTQMRRTHIYREELSRIRIHRTSAIRTGRKLGDVQMPPPGLGKRPEARDPAAPAAAEPGPAVAVAAAPWPAVPALPALPAVSLRELADARLSAARSQLDPLLGAAHDVEQWFRSPEFAALLSVAAADRALLDRLHRGVVSLLPALEALREARIFPEDAAALDAELERYWEQVCLSLDDAHALVGLCSSDQGQRALGALAGGEAVRAHLERLLEAALTYLESDGRRLIPLQPLTSDYDERLHVALETRRVEGAPAGKVLAVIRVGIARHGRVVRRPQVVVSG